MHEAPLPDKQSSLVRWVGLIAGLTGFLGLQISQPPQGLTAADWSVLAVALLMAVWWMTEAIPLAATALMPIILLPLLKAQALANVAASYVHPLIFLFLGGFLLARAIEKRNLHQRLSQLALARSRKSVAGILASIMATTAILSMWISNTAAAMIMMPVALSLIRQVGSSEQTGPDHGRFSAAIMLGVAYAATIGGMASLIGTPPNALLAGYLHTAHDIDIGFGRWMLLGVPVALVLLPVAGFMLLHFIPAAQRRLVDDALGRIKLANAKSQPLSSGAKLTACIAAIAVSLLILRPFIQSTFPDFGLSDSVILLGAGMLLFIAPSFEKGGGALLSLEDAISIRWDVLILFGGGLALASAIEGSGLLSWLESGFTAISLLPVFAVVIVAMAVTVYLGELASNTAIAAIFLPLASVAAGLLGVAPETLVLPVGLAASLGFMLPVATPPNAIVYASGEVTSQQMLKVGALLDVAGIVVVYSLVTLLGSLVLGT